jgi:hypothetical protein
MSRFARLSIWFAILAILWVGFPGYGGGSIVMFGPVDWSRDLGIALLFISYMVITVVALVLLGLALWRDRKQP